MDERRGTNVFDAKKINVAAVFLATLVLLGFGAGCSGETYPGPPECPEGATCLEHLPQYEPVRDASDA